MHNLVREVLLAIKPITTQICTYIILQKEPKMGSLECYKNMREGIKLVLGVLRKHHLSYFKGVSQKKELG